MAHLNHCAIAGNHDNECRTVCRKKASHASSLNCLQNVPVCLSSSLANHKFLKIIINVSLFTFWFLRLVEGESCLAPACMYKVSVCVHTYHITVTKLHLQQYTWKNAASPTDSPLPLGRDRCPSVPLHAPPLSLFCLLSSPASLLPTPPWLPRISSPHLSLYSSVFPWPVCYLSQLLSRMPKSRHLISLSPALTHPPLPFSLPIAPHISMYPHSFPSTLLTPELQPYSFSLIENNGSW